MIQRIQTLFLIIAALLDLSVFFTALYERAIEDPSVFISYGFAILVTLAMLTSVGLIFLYNNRQKQISGVKYLLLLQVLALGFGVGITFSLGGIGTYLWDEAIGDLLLVLALVFQYLALTYIKKDEELVKSMDRIR